MSKTYSRSPLGGRGDRRPDSAPGRGRKRRAVSLRAIRRESPDLRKLGRAVLAVALAEAEAEAQAQRDAESSASATTPSDNDNDNVEIGDEARQDLLGGSSEVAR